MSVCRAQRENWQKKVFDCETRLQDAKADRKENERDRRISEAVGNMKRLFQGDHSSPHVLLPS